MRVKWVAAMVMVTAVGSGGAVIYGQAGTREQAMRAAVAQKHDEEARAAPLAPADREARDRFLVVERFARLPAEEQAKGFKEFYADSAVKHVSPFSMMILSSTPENILDRRTLQGGGAGGDSEVRWAQQLQKAGETMSVDEVADKLGMRMWFAIASHVRTMQLLREHSKEVAPLVKADVESKEPGAFGRGCMMVSELHLTEFSGKVLAVYLGEPALAKLAYTALVWLRDPATVRPLLDAVKKDPKSVARHAGLFQGPLAGEKAPEELLALLDSPDAEVRYGAAYALEACTDAALAKPIGKLCGEKEPRFQSAAVAMASHLPDAAFAEVRYDLAALMIAPDQRVKAEAIACFARRKDLLAGPRILPTLNEPKMDEGAKVTLMQSLQALTGDTFGYDMHHWGPDNNAQAIAKYEDWLSRHVAP